jgi:hypothetical protein
MASCQHVLFNLFSIVLILSAVKSELCNIPWFSNSSSLYILTQVVGQCLTLCHLKDKDMQLN